MIRKWGRKVPWGLRCRLGPLSQFKGDDFQQLGRIDDPCACRQGLREVPFVTGHEEVGFTCESTGDEFIVIGVG